MIGVLTHHWAKDDCVDEARDLLNRNGIAQSQVPGFVSRQTLHALTDETKITTLVIWENEEIYEGWRASPEREAVMSGASDLWSRPTESERFEVVHRLSRV
ncbi:MAG: antibiotic biosynthesis monooxygenase [Gemmatimonadota bacterium]|nr:antibiotic biosynthesis monooxygenase [Gemmatimonadota bacterium]